MSSPTPPDTALACLHRYGGVRFEPCAGCEVDNLRAQLEDAKDGAEVLHEEIAKYRAQLSQRDAEIAELKGRIKGLTNPSDGRCMEIVALREALKERDRRIAEATEQLRLAVKWAIELQGLRQECASIADRLEGKETG